jgi:hypothetical protein
MERMVKLLNRVPAALLLALLAALATGVAGNALAYGSKAAALRQQWQEEESAGVSKATTDRLRQRLNQIESQRGGAVPSAFASMALVQDPFADLESQTQVIYRQVTLKSETQAQAALQRLKLEYGPTAFNERRQLEALARARKPSDFQLLARTWNDQADQLAKLKSTLSAKAGGLSAGRPADIVNLRDQLRQAADQLHQASLWTDPADTAVNAAERYLGSSYQDMLAQHDSLKDQLLAANTKVSQRLDLHNRGIQLTGQLPDLLPYGSGDLSNRADQAKQELTAARNDDQLQTAVGNMESVVNDLWQKKQDVIRRLAAGPGGCESNPSGKLVLVSLSGQRLVACDGHTTYLTTLVTTGRPGLETPTGTFSITGKWARYHMVSTCPQGTACYYDPAWVSYAMEFRNDGYYFHSWPQPQYGPGTQYAAYASHGCIHVPMDQLELLYNWADVGTQVIVSP